MTTKATVLNSQNPGSPEGYVLWWGLSDTLIPEADFRARWEAAGLPKAALPGPRSPHRNLSDAVKAAVVGEDRFLIRPIERAGVGGNVSKYAIVSEERDLLGERVTHHQESVVTLLTSPHPTDPDVTVSTFGALPPHPLADVVHAEWQKLEGSFTASEIRKAIVNTISILHGVVLREHGGVYWCAPVHAKEVEALRTVINGTGHSVFDVLPLFSTPIGTETISRAAARSLSEEVDALKNEIEGFKSEAPRGGVLARRLDQFDDLRARAALYRDVLALDVEWLGKALGELEATVDVIMNAPPPGMTNMNATV